MCAAGAARRLSAVPARALARCNARSVPQLGGPSAGSRTKARSGWRLASRDSQFRFKVQVPTPSSESVLIATS